jgi:predicted NAD-dependent protein-ADP-ribosyltransferase YbiA (DUF1768 family)
MTKFAMRFVLGGAVFLSSASAFAIEEGYPPEWWAPADATTAPAWEILPQQAGKNEVILSKRTELGIFSNFAATAFEFEDHSYASVEGFWQMMKFPDSLVENDPRKSEQFTWSHTREEVASLTGFEAKDAGNEGSKVMKELNINWVTYFGKKMDYHTQEKGDHYKLIRDAMKAKLDQTSGLKELLLKTGTLKLLPDHDQGENPPPAWKYFEIWTEFRDELKLQQEQHKN